MTENTTVRLLRLYQSDRGIWHYEIEHEGIVQWSSLHTRNEGEAKRKYEHLRRVYEQED